MMMTLFYVKNTNTVFKDDLKLSVCDMPEFECQLTDNLDIIIEWTKSLSYIIFSRIKCSCPDHDLSQYKHLNRF